MSRESDALETIKRDHIVIYPDKHNEDDSIYTITEFEEEFKTLEHAIKDYEHLKSKDLFLTNFNNAKDVKTPWISIVQKLTREEQHMFIEHMYYTYAPLQEEHKMFIAVYYQLQKDFIALSKDYDMLLEEYNLMKKEYAQDRDKLKALEIIKNMFYNEVDITHFLNELDEYENYEDFAFDYPDVPKEEYDLLKKVLTND